jgi:hypothetical protein
LDPNLFKPMSSIPNQLAAEAKIFRQPARVDQGSARQAANALASWVAREMDAEHREDQILGRLLVNGEDQIICLLNRVRFAARDAEDVHSIVDNGVHFCVILIEDEAVRSQAASGLFRMLGEEQWAKVLVIRPNQFYAALRWIEATTAGDAI